MSTRGLLGFRFTDQEGKKQFHCAYNGSDSYPSWLGSHVVDFTQKVLQHPITVEQMINNVQQIEWVDEDKKPTKKQLTKLLKAGFLTESDLEERKKHVLNLYWSWTLRDYQDTELLEAVFKGIPYLPENTSFIKDSLFCEYAYVLDLDRQVLEFYEGFQKIYGHLNHYIEVCVRSDGSHFLHNYHREDSIEDLGNGLKRYTEDGERYSYGPCKKIGEKPFNNLDGWKKFFPDEDFGED
jgi:hypothetical protein